ncbi:MAG TPA: hypothetical protein PKW59_13090 [Thermotogota bacterium]|nr:hypothetical protein [Thermotogota bacterium]
MRKDYQIKENKVLGLLCKGNKFIFEHDEYYITLSGKPKCQSVGGKTGGEPKTDIYVKAVGENSQNEVEIKISFKKKNADFFENKISNERAEQLFGPEWRSLIIQSTKSITENFQNKPLVYKKAQNCTRAKSITLGWKCDVVSKNSGKLIAKLQLSNPQLKEVYAGTSLPKSKRDSIVNGIIVPNSGIANFIFFADTFDTTQEIIDQMIDIDEYIQTAPDMYLAFKASNCRFLSDGDTELDGNRPLSVYIDWSLSSGKLTPTIVFNNPLNLKGESVKDQLICCMQKLSITHPDGINDSNFSEPSKIFE